MKRRRPRLRRLSTTALLLATAGALSAWSACKPKEPPEPSEVVPVVVPSAREVVPPAAPFNATPVAAFGDAGDLDGQSPFEQAKVYEANGQLWMARLVLERKALGSDGTKEETELLARICQGQADGPCLEECGKKLGRKIKLEAGAPSGADTLVPPGVAAVGGEHKEPDSELAHARDLVLKMQYDPARKALEPKVLGGKASREEIRLLRTVCEKQGDRMCVALCDTKLK
jgi:hypothetical protein